MARPLDDVDLRILGLLVRDGRMSHAAIGAAVGLSGPAIYERIRKLERHGAIRGYHADVDPQALGLGLLAFVEVELRAGTAPADLLDLLASQDEVLEAHRVFGYDGLLLKVVAADAPSLAAWLDRLRSAPGVASTRTVVSAATAFERAPAVRLPEGPRPQRRRS